MPAALLLAAALALQGDGWQALPLPALARPRPPAAAAPLATASSGSHLLLGPARPVRRDGPEPFHLPLPLLVDLVESDARAAGAELRCLPVAPPLLVRGSEAAVARARMLAEELDRSGRALAFELEVSLAPRGEAPVVQRALQLASGESAVVGERDEHAFVAGFEVDVASGTGVASPTVGRVESGRRVALTAWRAPHAQAVFVEGVLDLAQLRGLDLVDSGANDVGSLERPRVGVAQVHFAGLVRSGAALTVSVSGAPLDPPDWELVVRARAREAAAGAWRVADLTWLEDAGRHLPLPSPGAGLSAPLDDGPPRTAMASFSTSLLLGEIDAAAGASRRGPRPLALAPGLVAAPADDAAVWTAVERIAGPLARARGATRTVTVESGGFRASLPCAEGVPVRVLAGVETTVLVGWDPELAPEYWMAAPRVESAFDGTCVQGRLAGDRLEVGWWRARSETPRELSRGQTLHGRLELPRRSLEQGAERIAAPGPARPAPGLSVALSEDAEDAR